MTTQTPQRRTTLTSADHRSGDIWWTDYAAHDLAAAKEFYAGLFGWTFKVGPDGGGEYNIASVGSQQVTGMMELPEAMRAQIPPSWTAYINVGSAVDTCARVRELGGTVMTEATEVGESGWMAIAVDPAGAMFGIWQPVKHTGADLINSPGALSWTEVRSSDMAAAQEFYCALFGWTPNEMSMGDMPYVQFMHDGNPACGMCPWEGEGTNGAPSHWAITFCVESMGTALEWVNGNGGTVTWGPQTIPFGTIASIMDSQGGHVNILERGD